MNPKDVSRGIGVLMSAANKRKERIEKIRLLLERQGEDMNFTRVFSSGETSFSLRVDVPGVPAGAVDPVVGVSMDWATLLLALLAKHSPEHIELFKRALVLSDEEAVREFAAEVVSMGVHHRNPGLMTAYRAVTHMLIAAPEFFDGALRLLFASAEARERQVRDDEEGAGKILADAFKAEEQAARERLGLRGQGRRPAVKQADVWRTLLSFYEDLRPLPWTREQVAEALTARGCYVTPRTLTDYAALSVYGNWDALVNGYFTEFQHLESLEAEEMETRLNEAGPEVH